MLIYRNARNITVKNLLILMYFALSLSLVHWIGFRNYCIDCWGLLNHLYQKNNVLLHSEEKNHCSVDSVKEIRLHNTPDRFGVIDIEIHFKARSSFEWSECSEDVFFRIHRMDSVEKSVIIENTGAIQSWSKEYAYTRLKNEGRLNFLLEETDSEKEAFIDVSFADSNKKTHWKLFKISDQKHKEKYKHIQYKIRLEPSEINKTYFYLYPFLVTAEILLLPLEYAVFYTYWFLSGGLSSVY